MQVICCAMSPYSVLADQVRIEPLFALSLALSKSVHLFPNCKLSAGARASFTAGGEILNQCTLPYIEWALIFI